jgi:hypothetical protein
MAGLSGISARRFDLGLEAIPLLGSLNSSAECGDQTLVINVELEL